MPRANVLGHDSEAMSAKQAVEAITTTVLAAGFVPDGATTEQTVRIPTSRSPVFGGTGGEIRTLGGRSRYVLPGSDVRITIGPRTTNVYRVADGRTIFLANLQTRDVDPLTLAQDLAKWTNP